MEVTVPHFQPSFLQKIGSYFWKGPAIEYDACPVVVELISDWGVLAGHALTLAYYAFNKEVESIELPLF